MLERIWKRQYSFETAFFDPLALTHEDRIKWTKEFVFCLHQELAEVMDSIDWKTYHVYDKKKYDEQHTKEEIIDVFKFALNLCIVWGMDPNEIQTLFDQKSNLAEQRLLEQNGPTIIQRCIQEFAPPGKEMFASGTGDPRD